MPPDAGPSLSGALPSGRMRSPRWGIIRAGNMGGADTRETEPAGAAPGPIERARAQLLARWRRFPATEDHALRDLLGAALGRAVGAEPEVITVMNPVSRPMRLRLAVLVSDAGLDRLYRQEWAELSLSHDGVCYLVYRRGDGGAYAIEWSPATTVPESMMKALPETLARAMLEGDAGAG